MGVPIPPPHEPFVDTASGKVNEVWYRYLQENLNSLNSLVANVTTATTYAQTLLATTTASAVRTALGLGTAAVEASSVFQINAGTTVATASGSEVTVSTGIPTGVRQVTVGLNGVSINGPNRILVQIGTTSGFEDTAYDSASLVLTSSGEADTVRSSVGYLINTFSSLSAVSGTMTLTRLTGNTWVGSMNAACTLGRVYSGGGTKTLGAELDRVRLISNATATDAFDAGEANVFWEF